MVSFGPASTVWSVTLEITIGYHNLSRLNRDLCGFRFLKAFLKAFLLSVECFHFLRLMTWKLPKTGNSSQVKIQAIQQFTKQLTLQL